MNIDKQEWQEICDSLLDHHSLFYKIVEMGKPILSADIETACVTFDPNGDYINFLFNPEFWQKSTFYEKKFVICHESLHILLNHGKRFRDASDRVTANIAMDIVVNHTLVDRFGFLRDNISGWEDYCWIDTVFKNKSIDGINISSDETAEYYLNLLNRVFSNKNKLKNLKLIDSHDFVNEENKKLFEKLNDELSAEEKNSIKKFYEKHNPNAKAGKGSGNSIHFVSHDQLVVKKKWESVVKKWSLSMMATQDKDTEQWARKNKRFLFLNSTFFLPSEFETEDFNLENKKLKVLFFLDTSGSCWHLKDRFFLAAESLPKKNFEVLLFSFDTCVQETDTKTRKLKGGGGTSFNIIEQYIQSNFPDAYPDAVWIITDGFGDHVKPQNPKSWFWFITPFGSKDFIPNDSNVFNLDDFV